MAAQLAADFTIATTICGFASASYPYMLLGQMSIAQAAAPAATLRAVLATLPVGAAVLVPSLIFLYRSFGGHPNPDVPL
jgi:cytochrome d ubiquinol oxidase subunit II